jgi:hypothetical protein
MLLPHTRGYHFSKHSLRFFNTSRLGVGVDQPSIRYDIWFEFGSLHLRAGPERPVRYYKLSLSASCSGRSVLFYIAQQGRYFSLNQIRLGTSAKPERE